MAQAPEQCLLPPSATGYGAMDGQPAIYLYLAALGVNVRFCRESRGMPGNCYQHAAGYPAWMYQVPRGPLRRTGRQFGLLAAGCPALAVRGGNGGSEQAMTPPTISEGATGPVVRWAQYLLVRRTLSYTQIDGIFGPVTKAAVEQFQRDRHLAVDGIVGPATWAALGGDGAQPPTLAQGSHGPVVGKLQTALNEGRGEFAPASDPVLAVDGIYGTQTAAPVRGAQQLGGIAADGVVGLQTWALPVHAAAARCSPISAACPARDEVLHATGYRPSATSLVAHRATRAGERSRA